jgi:hypothetical protein
MNVADAVYVTDELSLSELLVTADTESGCIYSVFEITEEEARVAFEEKKMVSRVQEPEMATRIAAVTGTAFQAAPGFHPAIKEGESYLFVQDGNDATESGLSWYVVAFMARQENIGEEDHDCDMCEVAHICVSMKHEVEA